MPRGLINSAVAVKAGAVLPTETDGDPVNFHYFRNSGKTRLFARNSGATPRVVTIYISKTIAGQGVTPVTKSIPAGETHVFGTYDVNTYGKTVNVDVPHAEVKLRTVE